MENINLDDPATARTYIKGFVEMYKRATDGNEIHYVDTTRQRVYLSDMTDAQAVMIANNFADMEAKGNIGRRQ